MLAPAMIVEMWENAATQRNLGVLRGDGVLVEGPVAGDQACGETGYGRMLEPVQIAAEIEAFFAPKRLAGKRVLVTAGPTAEAIAPVRVLSNSSAGEEGYAAAGRALEDRGRASPVSGSG